MLWRLLQCKKIIKKGLIVMIKRILGMVLVLVMLLGLVPQLDLKSNAAEEVIFPEEPVKRASASYLIYTAEDLNNIRKDLAGNYTLMSDISLAGYNWEPIGTSSKPFTGYLDGNGYSIYGLDIRIENNTNQQIGLFGQMAGGTICNLNLVGGQIVVRGKNSKNVHIGSFCGHMHDSRIINCTSSVSIVARDNRRLEIGGIVGTIDQTKVTGNSMVWNCHNYGYITAYVEEYEANSPHCNAAGICGYARSDTSGSTIDFKGCSNSGKITSFSEKTQAHAVGIVAYASSQNGASLYIDRCYNTARVEADNLEVSGQRYVGGMAAYSEALYSNSKTMIIDCYNTGTILSSSFEMFF